MTCRVHRKEGYAESGGNSIETWRNLSPGFPYFPAGLYVVSVADPVSVAEKKFQKGIGCE